MINKFAIFIITHGRPTNQRTLYLLRTIGYTGDYYLVLDDEDETLQQYYALYDNSKILVFSKEKYCKLTDTGFVTPFKKFAVFARNAVEDFAQSLNYEFFAIFDDDITNFRIRYDNLGKLKSHSCAGIFDEILDTCINFMRSTHISCTAFGSTNMYRAGIDCLYTNSDRVRLCNCAFIRNCNIRVFWRLNFVEDLITSLDYNRNGDVWLQLLPIQVEFGASEGVVLGGNSSGYNDFGKYNLNFMPTIVYPDCNLCTYHHNSFHTTLLTQYSMPKIISSLYKK